jgi:hypothetical protein
MNHEQRSPISPRLWQFAMSYHEFFYNRGNWNCAPARRVRRGRAISMGD